MTNARLNMLTPNYDVFFDYSGTFLSLVRANRISNASERWLGLGHSTNKSSWIVTMYETSSSSSSDNWQDMVKLLKWSSLLKFCRDGLDWLDSGLGFRGRAQRCWSWRLQSLAVAGVAKRSCDHDTTENEIIARGLASTGVCVMPHIPRRAWQTSSVNVEVSVV